MQRELREQLDFPSNVARDSMVDVNDGYAVLGFMYDFLRKKQLAPTDAQIRNVTAALARYQGPPLVADSALEAFLCRSGEAVTQN